MSNKLEIRGYSERGLINSLLYEIYFSQNNLNKLNELLRKLITFPYKKVNFNISDAKIMIEQSFSDFGDADVLLLVKNNGKKTSDFY